MIDETDEGRNIETDNAIRQLEFVFLFNLEQTMCKNSIYTLEYEEVLDSLSIRPVLSAYGTAPTFFFRIGSRNYGDSKYRYAYATYIVDKKRRLSDVFQFSSRKTQQCHPPRLFVVAWINILIFPTKFSMWNLREQKIR